MYKDKEFRRYSKNLHHILLRIFHDDLEDPIFKRITINYVKLNRTKTFATVYLDLTSSLNPELVVSKLNRLNYLFKKKLLDSLGTYRAPNLKFVRDTVLETGIKIETLLENSIVENG